MTAKKETKLSWMKKGRCSYYKEHLPLVLNRKMCSACLEKYRFRSKELYASNKEYKLRKNICNKNSKLLLKKEVLTVYGDCSCANCKIKDMDVLSIDHIHNDGSTHKKKIGVQGGHLYSYLKRNNFPDRDRLQVLCMNCQFIKKTNGGTLRPPTWRSL